MWCKLATQIASCSSRVRVQTISKLVIYGWTAIWGSLCTVTWLFLWWVNLHLLKIVWEVYHISPWLVLPVASQSISYNALICFIVPKPPSILGVSWVVWICWTRMCNQKPLRSKIKVRGVYVSTPDAPMPARKCTSWSIGVSTPSSPYVKYDCYVKRQSQTSLSVYRIVYGSLRWVKDLSIPKMCCNVICWGTKLKCEYFGHFLSYTVLLEVWGAVTEHHCCTIRFNNYLALFHLDTQNVLGALTMDICLSQCQTKLFFTPLKARSDPKFFYLRSPPTVYAIYSISPSTVYVIYSISPSI